MRGGHGLSPGLKGSEEKVPGTRGRESALLPCAVLGPSPESCQIPNPPGPGGVVEQETTLACLKPSETPSFLAQEFQALKVAMEEKLSPPLSFQNKLNFTKCTQAVGAVKDVLSTACKNQWNHLQGKGIDGLDCQETEEGLCSPMFSQPLSLSLFPAWVGGGCRLNEHWPLSFQPWKLLSMGSLHVAQSLSGLTPL